MEDRGGEFMLEAGPALRNEDDEEPGGKPEPGTPGMPGGLLGRRLLSPKEEVGVRFGTRSRVWREPERSERGFRSGDWCRGRIMVESPFWVVMYMFLQ